MNKFEGTILVDMDGVLADTMGSAMNIIEQEHNTSLCHNDIQDYWFSGLPVETSIFTDILRRPGFYRGLDVISGAVRAVNRLRESYDVIVCTSPMPGVEATCEQEKREWLVEKFDTDFAEQAIVTKNKHNVYAKLLVDDNPDVINLKASWQPILFDQPWNRNFKAPRMYGWGDTGVIRERF